MIIFRLQKKEVTGVCIKSMMKSFFCVLLQVYKADQTNDGEETELGGVCMTFGGYNGENVSAVKPERMSL
jgi:hypothetical protein